VQTPESLQAKIGVAEAQYKRAAAAVELMIAAGKGDSPKCRDYAARRNRAAGLAGDLRRELQCLQAGGRKGRA
jgi:hypothetical protein